MKVAKDLVAASATPMVLGILAEGESYGYAILRRINELSGGTERTITRNNVDWKSDNGWYVDFNPGNKSPGERMNVDMQLTLGTLTIATNIPDGSACSIGGDSWVYHIDFRTGSYVEGVTNKIVARKQTGVLTVGTVVYQLQKGSLVGQVQRVTDMVPEHVQDASALFVGVPVKKVVRVFVNLGDYGPEVPGTCLFKVVIGCKHYVELELVPAPACFPVKGFAVSRESFVEPDVLPVLAGHEVAKPLVGELVRNKVVACKIKVGLFVVEGVLRQRGAARIFHPAVNEILDCYLRVFFKRVLCTKILFKKFHHFRSALEGPRGVLLSVRRYIVRHQSLFGCLDVSPDDYRNEIGRLRVRGRPVVYLAPAPLLHFCQPAVRNRGHARRRDY